MARLLRRRYLFALAGVIVVALVGPSDAGGAALGVTWAKA